MKNQSNQSKIEINFVGGGGGGGTNDDGNA